MGVAAVPTAVVEAQEGEVGGPFVRLEAPDLGTVGDHQRDAAGTQQVVDLVGEPARVAELERVSAGRQCSQRRRQPLVVPVKVRRQLPEHRSQLPRHDERLDPLVEPPHALVHVRKPLDVCEVATRLHCENEPRRRPLGPPADSRGGREPVEGRVHLDRVEERGVVVEPASRGQIAWIDNAAPVRVVPAGAAYADNAAVSWSVNGQRAPARAGPGGSPRRTPRPSFR